MSRRTLPRLARRLRDDRSGLAMLEFAFSLPILITLCLTGAELTNYITVKMRMSQLALQISDDAARMGTGSQLAAKTISENDINDIFIGAQKQSNELDLQTNGRIILSDVEPMASPNTTGLYQLKWQRCYGNTAHASQYGTAPTPNIVGIGPAGRQVGAITDNATMFVELYYVYKPLVSSKLAPTLFFDEIASMAVRDRRDLTGGNNGVYPVAGVTASTC